MQQRKPRILMIAPLPPPVHGSALMTKYIYDSKLINETFDLDWVNLSTSRKMTEIGEKSPIKVVRFFSSYFKTLVKLCLHRYDCCYLAMTCHGVGFLKDAPFALLCKLFGRKLVIHQHNKGMSKDVHNLFYRFLFKAVYRNSKVILLSERLYPDISEIVEHSQVMICPNGIPKANVYSKSNNTVPKLLFLSNLIASKGVFVLLDACKILKEHGYIFTCAFVGSETMEIDRTRFAQEVELRGLNNIVCYLGKKYDEDKQKLYAESDIFVFPTSYENETFGLVLLEAMQQSLPQISTATGGIPDVIEDGVTGFLSEINNPKDLADKIGVLLEDPKLRATMGEASFRRFNELYSLNKFETAITAALNLVLGEKS